MFARLGRWSFRHRWATLGAWLAAMILIVGVGSSVVGSAYSNEMEIPASESAEGFEVIDEHFAELGGSGMQGSIVFQSADGASDDGVRAAMETLFADIDGLDGVVSVISPYSEMGARQISPDGTIAYATINLDPEIDEVEASELGKDIDAILPELSGLRIEIGGAALGEFEPPESELIGLAFAVIVLILAFGSVLAMGLPIGVAVGGVGVGIGVIGLLSNLVTVPDFATTLGAMIGLGVGIDYALFIVTRYREGTREGLSPEEATVMAMDTAGRAVTFAGITVVISLLGLLLIGLEFVAGLGIAAAATVTVTMAASLTLLPALLGFAGPRVEVTRWRGLIAASLVAVALFGLGAKIQPLVFAAPLALVVLLAGFAVAPLRRQVRHRPPKPLRDTFWYRWSHLIQAHPWRSLMAGTAALGVLAIPVFGLRLGFSDEGNFAEDTTTRQAYDLLADGFGPGFNGPLTVAVELSSPDDRQALEPLVQALGAADGVASVSPPILDDPQAPRAALIQVIGTDAPQDAATDDLIRHLRSEVVPSAVGGTGLTAHVTGFTAASLDFSTYLSERTLLFFGVVLVLSFLLLMMVFRSLLVPLKAVVMNVLSIAASYGVVVAIFQWGHLSAITGVAPAPIEPFIPMMMFAIVFGLSMDYEVFLLSRIKEEYDRTGDAVNSVADGLAATARVITAAAAIMVVVFGSFLLEDARTVKLFGTGLGVAVLLDATLVRMLLVPATMELLGARNWWLPAWLDRLLPRLNVEGPAHHGPTGEHERIDEPELTSAGR